MSCYSSWQALLVSCKDFVIPGLGVGPITPSRCHQQSAVGVEVCVLVTVLQLWYAVKL
jgi:hypothetical protein